MKTLRLTVLALFAVSTLVTAVGCSPECVDFSDCAAKAKKAGTEFTCENNVCKAGSPFPASPDAGP
jgi:hypothetical protein